MIKKILQLINKYINNLVEQNCKSKYGFLVINIFRSRSTDLLKTNLIEYTTYLYNIKDSNSILAMDLRRIDFNHLVIIK